MTQRRQDEGSDLGIMRGPSGPIAAAGLILGAAAVALFFFTMQDGQVARREISPGHPPSLLAVNLAFCAMLLGAWAVYRVREMPRQWPTRLTAAAALLLGLAGPPIFFAQGSHLQRDVQAAELANVRDILAACRAYAQANGNHYPPTLAALVADHQLPPSALRSPANLRAPATQATAPASDYDYFGSDLVLTSSANPNIIVVVARKSPIKKGLTIGFADGRAEYVAWERIEGARAADTAARKAGTRP